MPNRDSVVRRNKLERKSERRSLRERKRNNYPPESVVEENAPILERASFKPIRALTEAQGHYMIAIQQSDIIFGVGCAGTGKSFIAATMAADALRDEKISKLIITRPNVETAATMGFIPGTLEEKYEPFFKPFRKILDRRLGSSNVELLIKRQQIEPTPVGFIRGETFENCWVILDEAQNLDESQMKTFLTRIGRNCKMIINGDIDQIDIKGMSGLKDGVNKLKRLSEVSIITFTEDDSVRSELCKKILKAYAK